MYANPECGNVLFCALGCSLLSDTVIESKCLVKTAEIVQVRLHMFREFHGSYLVLMIQQFAVVLLLLYQGAMSLSMYMDVL